jgi:integrase
MRSHHRGLLSVPRRRPAPFIYTPDQLAEIMAATQRVKPPLRAATCRALFGLLAATGMRVGEAIALTRADVDLVEGVITVRHAKFDRMRLVPLHPSVAAALAIYATTRERLCLAPCVDRFFVSVTGRALQRYEADRVFRKITEVIGLRTDTAHPRVHDLRHAFAVHTLIDAERNGADISAVLPVLSTYLGHVEPANTYWYLSAVPELMQLAAARLEPEDGQP